MNLKTLPMQLMYPPLQAKIKTLFFVFSLLFLTSIVKAQVLCNPPGWNVWLGLSDEWNDSTNWCAGIPTGSSDVFIPGTGGAGYFHPVIKSGVIAQARKLCVENDTLEINAPQAGSLTIEDSTVIKNNSVLKVFYPESDTAVLGNATDTNITFMPFRQSFKEQKMQLMYKNSEVLAQGINDGDVIEQIIIPVRTRRSTNAYQVNINMYYATDNAVYPSFTTSGFTSPVPVAPANCLAPQLTSPVTVFSGSVDLTGIPLYGSGNYTVSLNTPFQFLTNGNSPLIIEICYSSGSATSLNDDIWQTPSPGFRSVLLLANLGTYSIPACSWINTAPDGNALTQKLTSNLRPDLSFGFHTPYDNYPINIKGHWQNDGTYITGRSTVNCVGSAIQNIGGANPTTFYDLTINNNTGAKLVTSAAVMNVLNLNSGRLRLNSNTLTILNPSTGGIVRTTGGIQSESAPPAYGFVEWNIGTTTGSHSIPFKTSGNKYIPFVYQLVSGDVGTIKASTYATAADNLPYPDGVTNVNDTDGVNNSGYTVDRFWHLEKTGPSGKAKLKFTYLNTEAPAPIVNGSLRAHSYNYTKNKWKILTNPMTNTVNTPSMFTSQLLVLGVSGNNLTASDWALADTSSPLRMAYSVPDEAADEIEVTPNPFTDKIILSLKSTSIDKDETISLTLFTILGEIAAETNALPGLFSDGEQFEWSPGNLKNGIYFLVIQAKDEIHTERVVRMEY